MTTVQRYLKSGIWVGKGGAGLGMHQNKAMGFLKITLKSERIAQKRPEYLSIRPHKNVLCGDFSSGPVLLPQGAQVQFLVRELRYQCCMVQSKEEEEFAIPAGKKKHSPYTIVGQTWLGNTKTFQSQRNQECLNSCFFEGLASVPCSF